MRGVCEANNALEKEQQQSSMTKIIYIVLPVLLVLVWSLLDAQLSLLLFDKLAPSNRHDALQTKTVWVTGASSGIGAQLVCDLIKAKTKHGMFTVYKLV